MPILVLSLICLVISGALAFTNGITEPIISEAAAQRETAARYEMIPEADDFEVVTNTEFPSSIRDVYKATNNTGYVFTVTGSGYGGEMIIICSIGPDGRLMRAKALEQSETKGLGSRITETPFSSQFVGIDSDMDGIVAITGATISSFAYMGAIKDAFTAYEMIVLAGVG